MGDEEQVAAVVVAYRSQNTLPSCIASLARDAAISEIVVIDNSPSDEMRALVEGAEGHPSCRYIPQEENVGFARGCNLGVSVTSADWVALVNPDLTMTCSMSVLMPPSTTSGAAIVSGLLETGTGEVENVRPETTVLRECQKALVGARRSSRWEPDRASRWSKVPQVDGALMLIRRRTWDSLGGMDEAFELYYDDVDLCRRAEEAGGTWVLTKVVGRHRGSVSYSANRGKAYVAYRISRMRFLRKHYGARGASAALFIGIVEYLSRSASRQVEGASARRSALRLQWRELTKPGSIWVLRSGPADR
jgi:N-acetylglucosaminyl-diphospho-decaprenol L-rhamnosyltransferase